MAFKIGIDVGGTFTDFLVTDEQGAPRVFKTLSTPKDPAIGLIDGLEEAAASYGLAPKDFAGAIETIVHGTTVTTNATLTFSGAKTGLITTAGLRDAVEMRRGIREEQYNNRYTNVPPLAPRYLRVGVGGRLDRRGREHEPLALDEIDQALALFERERVEAIAICFMNAFADPAHEQAAAARVRRALPDVYLTVSTDLLPSIRFYDRVSTTVLNSYVGPKLRAYLTSLVERLKAFGFAGNLLIMQSNGGVIAPELAIAQAAATLLSGPAAGPGIGLGYARAHKREDCITVDMGGTSFDAALVQNGAPHTIAEGAINRYRIALPMLDINTIGAGGGSIGWIDEGGLLRMGPQSAGADPGPACYGRGGTLPACTDADLVLGYLDPDYFAGGKLKLDRAAAEAAIRTALAAKLGFSVEDAAAGMYRVINNNMAQGVREITIKRGFDPREFPMIVAGGAGPLHACEIARELEMPLLIVPKESSIFCAAGMLVSDLKHDFVRTRVARLDRFDLDAFRVVEGLYKEMIAQGEALLAAEKITPELRTYRGFADCRYLKQYHEVSVEFSLMGMAVMGGTFAETLARLFHEAHNRMYGYSLEAQKTPIEVINWRLQAVGRTNKPAFREEPRGKADPAAARKGARRMYVPEEGKFATVPVYDGHRTRHGHRIPGPALIEQVNTAILVTASYDCVCDKFGSFALYRKGREDLVNA
ncbi:MAG: hydantoinase/oxoprolinase family protein [Alphaproteobacteria bacterium]|nr:hydantoinase/oxoprolinase family protein [Alphaproteobacteria bacterium]